jgi:hypothetical protein
MKRTYYTVYLDMEGLDVEGHDFPSLEEAEKFARRTERARKCWDLGLKTRQHNFFITCYEQQYGVYISELLFLKDISICIINEKKIDW